MTSPGRIEMEDLRFKADRLEAYYDIVTDIEGPVADAASMADLTMQWWGWMADDKAEFAAATGTAFSLSEREQRIVACAFSNMWNRLREIDERLSADISDNGRAK